MHTHTSHPTQTPMYQYSYMYYITWWLLHVHDGSTWQYTCVAFGCVSWRESPTTTEFLQCVSLLHLLGRSLTWFKDSVAARMSIFPAQDTDCVTVGVSRSRTVYKLHDAVTLACGCTFVVCTLYGSCDLL